ncbi:MAG: hypothetical protein J6B43_01915, partial [Lachnospiraceae bacterium]|nr:hypothetical protein [Lachnospiraceae bacterium]
RLDHFIHDIVTTSSDQQDIRMSPPVAEAMKKLRGFMFERVYQNPVAKSEEGKAEILIETLFQYYLKHIDDLPGEYLNLISQGEPREKVVCDYVGAMSDRFAIAQYEEIYIPKSWIILWESGRTQRETVRAGAGLKGRMDCIIRKNL